MRTKRAFLVEPGRFELDEVDIQVGTDELMIKVEVCGLCPWELNYYHGKFSGTPMSLGHEVAGTVVEIGSNIKGFSIGDIVTGLPTQLAGFSEYMTVASEKFVHVSPDIPIEHALGEPLKCVVTVLRAAAPESGDYGVVFGAGPMGLLAIQGMAGNLLGGLIAVDIDDTKLALAAGFGATHTINPLHTNLRDAINDITKGYWADFAIEGTGSARVINDAVSILKRGRGRLVLMSSYKSHGDGIDLLGMSSRGIEMRVAHPGFSLNQHDDLRRAVHLLNTKVFRMESLISHRFDLEQIQLAFESLDQRPPGYMKGIVLPNRQLAK